ncbi:MAG: cystathionine gamma-synthase [Planctomycetes bacterium]|nr:cystathionine gamma-synthase [Planctomycetota bacterium]
MSERPFVARARTRVVRAGVEADAATGAVMPPIHLSSTFAFERLGKPRAYDYTRTRNPTRDQLTSALAELEGAAGGVVTASGMAAIAVALKLGKAGGAVVAPHDGYGGTYRLLKALAARGEIRFLVVDQTDLGAVESLLEREGEVAVVWMESPSNPLLRITDLAAVIALAKRRGALAMVDNTFLSPALQNPLALGADVVVHSTTKYLNGHSDVVGGAALAASPEHAAALAWWGNCLGVTGAPFDSFLTLRGIRTLHLRMAAHEENARGLTELLASHGAVRRVYYPGLPAHPGHEIARRQQRGFGAMLSFELEAADEAGVAAFLEGLRCFSLAESLGGVESLICHPATMTHAAMDAEARSAAGITGNLLRISAGIEDLADLRADLLAALDRSAARGHWIAFPAAEHDNGSVKGSKRQGGTR